MPHHMHTARELFLHKLGQTLEAERRGLKLLPQLEREALDRELKQRMRAHVGATKRHVATVERIFKRLGETVHAHDAPVFEAIERDHTHAGSIVGREMREPVATATAQRVEHNEIAAYTDLVAMARALGESEIAKLLEQTLKQEKEMLRELDKLGRRRLREVSKELAAAA